MFLLNISLEIYFTVLQHTVHNLLFSPIQVFNLQYLLI